MNRPVLLGAEGPQQVFRSGRAAEAVILAFCDLNDLLALRGVCPDMRTAVSEVQDRRPPNALTVARMAAWARVLPRTRHLALTLDNGSDGFADALPPSVTSLELELRTMVAGAFMHLELGRLAARLTSLSMRHWAAFGSMRHTFPHMPGLRSLTLRAMEWDDSLLARMPALEHLALAPPLPGKTRFSRDGIAGAARLATLELAFETLVPSKGNAANPVPDVAPLALAPCLRLLTLSCTLGPVSQHPDVVGAVQAALGPAGFVTEGRGEAQLCFTRPEA